MTVSARRILANTAYRLIADVGAKIASIALVVVMARELGDSRFGVYAFAFALVTLVTALGDFGQDKILTREVTRVPARVDRYFLNTLVLKLTVSLPALALAVAVLVFGGADRTTKAVVVLLGLVVIVELLSATVFATYQAYEELRYIPVVLLTERFLAAIVGIVALLLGAGVVTLAAILLGAALVAFALALALLFRRVVRPRLVLDVGAWPALMRAAAPIGLAGVFSVVLFRIDAVLLAAFESDDVVGHYGAAYRLFETTLFISWAVGAAVYPGLSRSSRTSSPPVSIVYGRSVKLLVALSLPVAAGTAVLAAPAVELIFGDEFADAADALRLLAPAVALYPVGYLASYLLVSQDRSSLVTLTYAVVAVQNIAFNLVLIPAFSLQGAALTTSISELLAVVLLVWFGRSYVERAEWSRALIGPVTASALATAVMATLAGELALAAAAGAGVYVVALVLIERAVFPQDARALWTSLRPAGGRPLPPD